MLVIIRFCEIAFLFVTVRRVNKNISYVALLRDIFCRRFIFVISFFYFNFSNKIYHTIYTNNYTKILINQENFFLCGKGKFKQCRKLIEKKKNIYKYESKDFKKLFSLILLFLILKIIILKIGLLKITYTYIIIQEILRRFFWKCFAKSQSIIRDNFETNNYIFMIYHEKK